MAGAFPSQPPWLFLVSLVVLHEWPKPSSLVLIRILGSLSGLLSHSGESEVSPPEGRGGVGKQWKGDSR